MPEKVVYTPCAMDLEALRQQCPVLLDGSAPADGAHDIRDMKRAVVNYSCLTNSEAASSRRGRQL
jgi:hypothetical protein